MRNIIAIVSLVLLSAVSCKVPQVDADQYRRRSDSFSPQVFSKIDARTLRSDVDSVIVLARYHAAVSVVADSLLSEGKVKDADKAREAAIKQPERIAAAREDVSLWKTVVGLTGVTTAETAGLFSSYDPALTIYFYVALLLFVLIFVPKLLRRFLRKPTQN